MEWEMVAIDKAAIKLYERKCQEIFGFFWLISLLVISFENICEWNYVFVWKCQHEAEKSIKSDIEAWF